MVGFPYNVLTAVALMLCQCPRGEAASGAGRPSLSGGQRVAENERNASLNPPPPPSLSTTTLCTIVSKD